MLGMTDPMVTVPLVSAGGSAAAVGATVVAVGAGVSAGVEVASSPLEHATARNVTAATAGSVQAWVTARRMARMVRNLVAGMVVIT